MKVLLVVISLLVSLGRAQNGVFSFVDLDPTPPELFDACLNDARDIYGFTACTSNAEIVDTRALKSCNEGVNCTRYAYNVPFFPEKLGLRLGDTYDELWERNIEDIKDYAYDAWESKGCANAAYGAVLADVNRYAHGDASLRYWSEVSVAASYYLPAALWWRFPFPDPDDFSDDDSDRIIVPSFSLIPNPNQYANLAQQTANGIYYFQRPAFPDVAVPYEASEIEPGFPGLADKELLKATLDAASVLEYSQFGHGRFFEVYGERRVVDIVVVWVKSCVPSPSTSPVMAFPVPFLPKAETRWTSAAEGYPLSKVGETPWMPDPAAAFEANSLSDAAERFRLNPNAPYLIPGLNPRNVELASLDPLDPRVSLEAFLDARIPFATDRSIPQEVVEDAKSDPERGGATGSALGSALGLGGSLEERASLAEVLNCPPVTVGPSGSQTYPILSLDENGSVRTANVNEAVQYLFRQTADYLYDDETRAAIGRFQSSYGLPEASYPQTWQTSSGAGLGLGFDPSALGDLSFFGGTGSGGVLCVGDEGGEVAVLDRLLARAGYGSGASSAGLAGIVGGSGNEFSEATETNLKNFQADKGLEPDGTTSPEVWAVLHAAGGDRADPVGYAPPVLGLPPGQPWPSVPAPAPTEIQGETQGVPADPNAAGTTTGTETPAANPEAGTGEGATAAGDEAAPPPPPDSQELAQEVLSNPNISLQSGAASGLTDGSDPLSNVQAAANAQPAKRSEFGGVPSGETWLSPEMLEGLLQIGEYFQVEVSAVAGGVYPAGSPHYSGSAFTISAIDGVPVESLETVTETQGSVSTDEAELALPGSVNGEATQDIFALTGSDINEPYTRTSNNPLLQVTALCELGNAVEVNSPLTDERYTGGLECRWPVAELQ